MTAEVMMGLLIPFAGTSLGAAMVFFFSKQISDNLQKILTGFAAGVMVAASFWSLLQPSLESSEAMGKLSFIPAAVGFMIGIGFLLLLDEITPHMHMDHQVEGPSSGLKRTTKLILAVTAPCVNDTLRARVCDWIAMAERGDHKALMIDTAENSYSEAYLQKYRKLYPLLGAVGRPKSYERFLANARAILDFDARGELGKIACPTLILGGEEDRIVGAEASRELHGAIAGSELYIYPGLGHAAYEEAKDFNERIYRFLEG